MPSSIPLLIAMAEKCRDVLVESALTGTELPPSLDPKHLLWMCQEILAHVNEWPETKTQRWIGFLQGALIANRMLALEDVRRMFDKAKNEYATPDEDLVDHLDPGNDFAFDIGGEG